MLRWPFLLLSKFSIIIVLGYIAWVAWENIGPSKPEISSARQEVADSLMSDIVKDIRSARGDLDPVALLYFSNDHSDYFTDGLRSALESSGVVNLRDRTTSEKARDLLSLDQHTYESTEEALKRGRSLDVQGVIYGTINEFESYSGGTRLDVQVHLAELSSEEDVFSNRYISKGPAKVSVSEDSKDSGSAFPWLQRIAAWAAVVLLLPVCTISFIRTMLNKRSNAINAMILGIYTLVAAMFALLLFGAAIASWISGLLFIAAVLCALLYYVWFMGFALRLES